MRVGVHAEASNEALAAATWYEERRAGLGGEFLQAASEAVRSIAANPVAWPVTRGNRRVRRFLMPHFPYCVLFAVGNEHVLIVAFAHLRRKPGYWRHRLRSA
jgi:hypothetical protein